MGQIIGLLLFPALLGWIAYRVAGRSNLSGNITFALVLALLVLARLGQNDGPNPAGNRSEIHPAMSATSAPKRS